MKNNSDNQNSYINIYLKEAFSKLGKDQTEIVKDLGVSQPYVSNLMNGKKSVGKNMAEKLVSLYGFDKAKILTGEGSMLVSQTEEVVPEEEEEEDDLVLFLRDERKGYDITLTDIHEKTRIPVKVLKEAQNGISELSKKQRNILSKYIDEVREYFQNESIGKPKGTPTGYYYPEVYAKAGFDIANFNDEMQRLPVYIPNFSKDVTFINVYGDSMYPKYKAGDVIGIKPVDFLYLVFGHPYVVVFDNGDVNIKYVRRGSDDEHVSLESENPKYDPREYPLKIIRAFYAVEGSVKKERM